MIKNWFPKIVFFLIFLFLFCGNSVSAAGECINPATSTEYYASDYVCSVSTEDCCGFDELDGKEFVSKKTVAQHCPGDGPDCTGDISYGECGEGEDISINYCDECYGCSSDDGVACIPMPIPIKPEYGVDDVLLDTRLEWCEPDIKPLMSYKLYISTSTPTGGEETILQSSIPSAILPPTEFCNYNFELDTDYFWKVAACGLADGEDCGDYTHEWKFHTAGTLEPPAISSPLDDAYGENPIGLPIFLDWSETLGADYYNYKVYKDDTETISDTTTGTFVELDRSIFAINTFYSWKVQPCSDIPDIGCGNWTNLSYFKTTGEPPLLLYPEEFIDASSFPIKFEWEAVSGANSYIYELYEEDEGKQINFFDTTKTSYNLDYALLRDKAKEEPQTYLYTEYLWRVKTCASENGYDCGDWNEKKFILSKLPAPTNPSPEDGSNFYTYENWLSWDSVEEAVLYKYEISYSEKSAEENNEDCKAGVKIYGSTDSSWIYAPVDCLGKYEWRVQACLDEACSENEGAGEWTPSWAFNYIQPTPPASCGIVPCGRPSDCPDTPWNERDDCELKHLFLILKNIIDLFLWRIGLIILVLLTMATGVIYYFSMGAPSKIVNIKSIWQSAGRGYTILFLSWIIINLLLSILGFDGVEFGNWWEIKF